MCKYLCTVFIYYLILPCYLYDKWLLEKNNKLPKNRAKKKKRCDENKIYFGHKKICLDTNAALKENIGCLRLNDMKEFYVNIKNKENKCLSSF